MRIWHHKLIPYLPRKQLVSQLRECVAIAKAIHDNGTPNHILVNRLCDYPLNDFHRYCAYLIPEMRRRGYTVKPETVKKIDTYLDCPKTITGEHPIFEHWHDARYLRQCLCNLEEKAMCGGITSDEWQVIYDRFHDFTDLWI